jgi:1-acyl-sn-glycerol-3-phosphate acyltransferase
MIARQAQRPIIPCYIHGANKLSKCFWGRQQLSISFGKPLSTEWVTSFPETKDSYQLMAQEVMNRIGLLKAHTMEKLRVPNAGIDRTENSKKVKKALENP